MNKIITTKWGPIAININPKTWNVCKICEDPTIQALAWVDMNTLKFADDHLSDGKKNIWCSNCGEHVEAKIVMTYNSLIM